MIEECEIPEAKAARLEALMETRLQLEQSYADQW